MNWTQLKQILFGKSLRLNEVQEDRTEELRRAAVFDTLENILREMENREQALAQQGEDINISAKRFVDIYSATLKVSTGDMDRVIAISKEEESTNDVAYISALSLMLRKINIPYTRMSLVGQRRIVFNSNHGLL